MLLCAQFLGGNLGYVQKFAEKSGIEEACVVEGVQGIYENFAFFCYAVLYFKLLDLDIFVKEVVRKETCCHKILVFDLVEIEEMIQFSKLFSNMRLFKSLRLESISIFLAFSVIVMRSVYLGDFITREEISISIFLLA